MICFIDTSAFLAILNADDENHLAAAEQWKNLLLDSATLICTDYVLIETIALIQHRFGLDAVKVFDRDIFPLLQIEWIDETIYRSGISAAITADRKKLSIVDCISFDVMRRLQIQSVFTFDKHFAEQGFNCSP